MVKSTFDLLEQATKRNIPKGICYYCKKEIENKRKKWYCNDLCEWNDRFMSRQNPPRFRNHLYMNLYLGRSPGRGQGKRSGGMISGSMSAYVAQWSGPVPVTLENIDRSRNSKNQGIYLANGQYLNYQDACDLAELLKNKTS